MGRAGRTRTIKVDHLARVEGEGALHVRIRDGRVLDVKLRIFEPPRFFEALLRGRRFTEVPDITARICGICPVAYQMSAVHAVESLCGACVDGPLRDLRRLIYCGEWIESHALHVVLLHAPDFLGYESAVHMARDHPRLVETGLRLKRAGNAVVSLLGGREIHPVNVRVGGFYKVPTRAELLSLRDRLERARDIAVDAVRWSAGLPFPQLERDYEFLALRHPGEYPFNEGRLASTRGLDVPIREFGQRIEEHQVPHSTALHARLRERGAYCVGPLARLALNFDRLTPAAREAAVSAGLAPVCRNPFRSIVVRCVEILYACEEALRIVERYRMPERPWIEVEPRAGVGHGCTEAPRGTLYHRYELDGDGTILGATIVPPTSQNQATIEEDLHDVVAGHLDLDGRSLTWKCEQAIRNYDPCISCSTHFLRLHVDRQ
jgi:coenzyme F420-reducing hydrogenase alpha subunit